MAEVPRWIAYVTLKDGKLKDSTVDLYISEAEAQAYAAAADPVAAAATPAGLLLQRIANCSDATRWKYGVRFETQNDTTVPPALDADVYHSEKVYVGLKAGLKSPGFHIPAWKRTAFTQVGRDGSMALTAGTGAPIQTQNLITSVEAVVLSLDGDAVTVTQIKKNK